MHTLERRKGVVEGGRKWIVEGCFAGGWRGASWLCPVEGCFAGGWRGASWLCPDPVEGCFAGGWRGASWLWPVPHPTCPILWIAACSSLTPRGAVACSSLSYRISLSSPGL